MLDNIQQSMRELIVIKTLSLYILSATCLYKLTLSYCRLILEPDITTVSSSSIFCHILFSINIRFLLEQYLSGTLFLKPASTRILSPHSRCSCVTRPEQCAHPPIVVIRESGLTITELELQLAVALKHQSRSVNFLVQAGSHHLRKLWALISILWVSCVDDTLSELKHG